jgi:hypothetical protein
MKFVLFSQVDGELYSEGEYMIAHWLVRLFDNKNVATLPVPFCNRCFHWYDGPRVQMKQILEGVEWRPKPFGLDNKLDFMARKDESGFKFSRSASESRYYTPRTTGTESEKKDYPNKFREFFFVQVLTNTTDGRPDKLIPWPMAVKNEALLSAGMNYRGKRGEEKMILPRREDLRGDGYRKLPCWDSFLAFGGRRALPSREKELFLTYDIKNAASADRICDFFGGEGCR